ncbi:hypothetical protein SAMN05216436_12354 [bacterium A37T11]|nr:hypothetical protein SAMN05216436_12354 [bacterium A37T11]
MKTTIFFLCVCFSVSATLKAQQVQDTSYQIKIKRARYELGQGPKVLIDEGHHNFHTMDGRYKIFSTILKADGFQVSGYPGKFSVEGLKGVSILVIANALSARNENDWSLPTPSAFSADEISVLKKWVSDGGSLLLIADHMPFPGAASDLGQAFGFKFFNGFAIDSVKRSLGKGGPDIFSVKDQTLATHIAVQGSTPADRVNHVATFGGQAFNIPKKAISLLKLRDGFEVLLPDTAWKFHNDTKKVNVGGLSQAAILQSGKGRVAVFGEAALFSAQVSGKEKRPMGVNHPLATENVQFLLNVIHWLNHLK